MSPLDVLLTAGTIIGLLITMLGLAIVIARTVNPRVYRWELRKARELGDDAWAAHCERKLGLEPAPPAVIYPLAMHRARRDHERAAL